MDIYAVESNVNYPLKQRGYIGSFFNRTFRKRHLDSEFPIKIFDNIEDVERFLTLQNSQHHYTVNHLKGIDLNDIEDDCSPYYRDLVPAKKPGEKAVVLPPYREIKRGVYQWLLELGNTDQPIR